jgi:CubicO group peptidase (beta-lactamase class C family)
MAVKAYLYHAALSAMRPYIRFNRALYPDEPVLRTILNRHAVLSGVIQSGDGTFIRGTCQKRTFFRTASLTKMVTAVGILKLAEQGALGLDEPVASFTPLPLNAITVRQLLSHTSGLRDPVPMPASHHPVPLNKLIPKYFPRHMTHDFCYSNFGFGILGSVMEYVTGESVEHWMQSNVFAPLGMHCTYDITKADIISDSVRLVPLSKAFNVKKRKQYAVSIHSPDPQMHYNLTVGSLYSDVTSIQRVLLLIANKGEGFLSAASVRAMQTAHGAYGTASPRLAYGLGLQILHDKHISPEVLYGHQGLAYGSVHAAFVAADSKRTLVSLNGGASEAKTHHLSDLNRDLCQWAFRG